MRDVQKLRDLLERVEKATGPDRDLDLAIAREFGTLGHAEHMSAKTLTAEFSVLKRYTASLDASIALVERMLPGCAWNVDKRVGVDVVEFTADVDSYYGQGANATLAILSAILSALISQAEGEGA